MARILCIDDDAASRELVKQILAFDGHTATTANLDESAARLWRSNRWLAISLLVPAVSLLAYLRMWQQPYPNLRPGDAAPDVAVIAPTGEHMFLHNQHDAVIINFVSVDCAVCADEIAVFDRWRANSRAQIWIVAADALSAADWQDKRFPVAIDSSGEVADGYTLRAYPASFLVRGGVVRAFRYGGPITETQLQDYLDRIGALINGDAIQ